LAITNELTELNVLFTDTWYS